MESSREKLTDPGVFLAIEDLELAARTIVEGSMLGVHRSPFTGLGGEFETHREYHPGDDLRHVNWKLWARTDQMFLKQYRMDTNNQVYLVLDISGSMGTKNGPSRKFDWGTRAAAALAFLALSCRDAAGLVLLKGGISEHIPARVAGGQFNRILSALEHAKATESADVASALDQAIHLYERRGIVIYFGDLFDNPEGTLRSLSVLRHQGHDVAVFHVLDPWELELPANGRYLMRDLESGEKLRLAAAPVRARYAKIVEEWREGLRKRCEAEGITYTLATTDHPLVESLVSFLGERSDA